MPTDLSIELRMDDTQAEQLRADENVRTMLDSYIVDSPAMAAIANTDMRASIVRIAEIKAAKAKFVEPAKQIIANAEALFDPAIEARENFVAGLRSKLADFTREQQRIADEARRRQEEEERTRRQEAEQQAAAERARAEQVAANERKQADEAEQRRKDAEAAGNKRAAAAAAA